MLRLKNDRADFFYQDNVCTEKMFRKIRKSTGKVGNLDGKIITVAPSVRQKKNNFLYYKVAILVTKNKTVITIEYNFRPVYVIFGQNRITW